MGGQVSRTDFEWTEKEKVHKFSERPKEILEKYPEIKNLFGHDPTMLWKVSLLVITQMIMLPIVSDLPWSYIFILAYCFGGVINHALQLAIHEIGHNLAFGHSRPLANRFLGMWANLPIGIPFSVSFKLYHQEHHHYLGVPTYDMDIPTYFEAQLFCTSLGKVIWLIVQIFFYLFRPLIVHPKAPTKLELLNTCIQLTFDFGVYYLFGVKSLAYMLLGSFLVMGLHPLAGHFISEHYMFDKGMDTYSYYGILNLVSFNVGYHNEHHDFPAIPACNLPKVREIAKEYYDNIPYHTSWVKVLYDFITDPAIGPYARNVRENPKVGVTREKLRAKQRG